MSQWLEVKLGDYVNLLTGFPFKSKNYSDFEEDIKLLRSDNIAQGYLRWENVKRWKLTDDPRESNYFLKTNDVILAMDRPWIEAGLKYSIISNKDLPCLLVQRVACLRAKEILNQQFLRYVIGSKSFTEYVCSIETGTAVPHISGQQIKDYEFLLPPLPEQKAIASVLSSLDDKIDLLHRQNKTLEAMAETLFRQWFIEEAKEDWSEFHIRDLEIYIADYVANGSFASLKENVTLITEKSDYALFIRNTDLKSNFANKVYVDEHSYNFLAKTKLYGGEVIISNVADVGSVHLCPRFNVPMTLGNNIIMLRSKFNYFLYLYFTSSIGQDALYAITSGSAQQKFNKTDFRALKISLPNLAILDEFNELVSSYFIKKEYNLNQIQTLENLRDTLLPKLMSGEVRVQYQTVA